MIDWAYECNYCDKESFNSKYKSHSFKLLLLQINMGSAGKNLHLLNPHLGNLKINFDNIALSEFGLTIPPQCRKLS